MRTLATVIILLFGGALIFVHQRYNSALSDALEEETARVPVPLGPIDAPDASALRFSIQNIEKNQRVLLADGSSSRSSDWTVFDCIPDEDPAAAFRLALSPIPPMTDQMQVGGAEAILWVTDRRAGDRLVELMGAVMDTSAPPPRDPDAPLIALRVSMTVLGRHLPAGDGQWIHNSGSREEIHLERGPWTASRWFIDYDGFESEVWFNFDLGGGRGEIVQKSDEDTDALLETISICLRDGPRPPRTPADDPGLTTFGPHIQGAQRTSASAEGAYLFTPASSLLLVTLDSESLISLIDPEKPRELVKLTRLEGIATSILCGDDRDETFVIQESSPTPVDSSAWWQSPQRIWHFDRKTNERRPITGPWGDFGSVAGPKALSPDGRYLIINLRHINDNGERIRATYVYDFQTDTALKAAVESSSEVISWSGGENEPLRCQAMSGGSWRFSPDYQRHSYVIDPVTGSAQRVEQLLVDHPGLSPDRTRRFDLVPGERIDVYDVETDKRLGTFRFHRDDQRFAREGTVVWVSPRYLLFQGKRSATIDVETMKMCYLTAPGDDRGFQFSPNFKWAATAHNGELQLARVVIGPAAPTTAPITSARQKTTP